MANPSRQPTAIFQGPRSCGARSLRGARERTANGLKDRQVNGRGSQKHDSRRLLSSESRLSAVIEDARVESKPLSAIVFGCRTSEHACPSLHSARPWASL